MPPFHARNRNWCFTIFNLAWKPQEGTGSKDSVIRYLVYQREKAPDTGRLHYQGYAEFTKALRMQGVKDALAEASTHVEPRRGTREEARQYCMKAESRDGDDAGPFEFGEFVHSSDEHIKTYVRAKELIKGGAPLEHVFNEMPAIFFRHPSALKEARAMHLATTAKQWRTVEVRVYYGATGLGKSRRAHHEFPDAFPLNLNKSDTQVWFDGYDGQAALIIDDFDARTIPYRYLLQLLDGHPCRLAVKGAFSWALWTTVILTTNVPPHLWYPTEQFERGPLERRITHIIEFGGRPRSHTQSPTPQCGATLETTRCSPHPQP